MHELNSHLDIFSRPQVLENCRAIFASPNRYFTENSRWVPLEKEREKIHHYQDVKVEIQKIWNCKSVSVVPIVIWALEVVTKNLMTWVTKIGTPGILNLLQKGCLLGTAKIIS